MIKKRKKPMVLVVLDGFGQSEAITYNAIYQAKTPHFDSWLNNFPHTTLAAAGTAVGLLDGNIGNSEVGHLTLGSGRVVPQPVVLMSEALQNGDFRNNPLMNSRFEQLKKSGKRLHLMGLLSDACVHSTTEHLFAFLQAAQQHGIKEVFVHAFLDGRDTPPRSAERYLNDLDNAFKRIGVGTLASLHGRFYAMDRDNNWNRIEQSYRIMTEPQKNECVNWQTVLKKNYQNSITDEFIPPVQCDRSGVVRDGDGIIFFNFRPDRARQLTKAFVSPDFNHFKKETVKPCWFITPTRYAPELKTDILFERRQISNTLTEVLNKHNKTVFAIAETEKYAHVTYFFNGGREQKLSNETRMLIPSITAKDYKNLPEMSAPKITQSVVHSLQTEPHDFYLINYANADMVAHSGNMHVTIKAIECLDDQLKQLYDQVVLNMDGTLIITADHGNAEQMFDEKTQQALTAHTTNKVPFIMINNSVKGKNTTLPLTQLADVAPFILRHMQIKVPQEMRNA